MAMVIWSNCFFGILQWNPSVRWALLMGVAGSLAIASLSHHTEFLYFQF